MKIPDPRLQLPTQEQWEEAVSQGFSPDGSSNSTDTIFGVRIGRTSTDYLPGLPANLHDFRYWCGGGPGGQFMADTEHYWQLRYKCDGEFRGWKAPLRWLARIRIRARYRALRELGYIAWDGHRDAGHTGPNPILRD